MKNLLTQHNANGNINKAQASDMKQMKNTIKTYKKLKKVFDIAMLEWYY